MYQDEKNVGNCIVINFQNSNCKNESTKKHHSLENFTNSQINNPNIILNDPINTNIYMNEKIFSNNTDRVHSLERCFLNKKRSQGFFLDNNPKNYFKGCNENKIFLSKNEKREDKMDSNHVIILDSNNQIYDILENPFSDDRKTFEKIFYFSIGETAQTRKNNYIPHNCSVKQKKEILHFKSLKDFENFQFYEKNFNLCEIPERVFLCIFKNCKAKFYNLNDWTFHYDEHCNFD